jgi:mannose-6-phosphate isomerase-like protein (cupin superfamily)
MSQSNSLAADHIPLENEGTEPAAEAHQVRRLVTAVNAEGKSYFAEDSRAPHMTVIAGNPSFVATDLWRTAQTPVQNGHPVDDGLGEPVGIEAPRDGSLFRIVEFPPDSEFGDEVDLRSLMHHRTASLDYAIVLSGEIWAVLDSDERLLKPGEVVIQRGTAHSWSNRSEAPALVAFIMIGGTAEPAD